MFNPTRDQARQFLIEAWRKRREKLPATALETIAADIAELHPEYQPLLACGSAVLEKEWTPEQGETNPFLHLSLHLAIAEQLSIDQPPGIRAAFDAMLARHGDHHRALHAILDCLSETIWRAQRDRVALDSDAYLECIRRAV